MDVDPLPWSILIASLLVVGGAIAAEASFARVSRSEMRRLADEGDTRARTVEHLLRDPAQFLLAMLLLRTAGVLAAGATVVLMTPDGPSAGQLVGVGIVVWLLFAALQAAGRSWAHARGQAIALGIAPVVRIVTLILWPLAALLRRASLEVGEMEQDEVVEKAILSEDNLRRLLAVDDTEEAIPDSDKQMIASILEMNETVARELMVPRIDMVALSVDTTLHDALIVINGAGHSRIPVYEDNIDHVVGFLYAKDLLRHFEEERGDETLQAFLRPAYFVPVSKKVNTLLREMQRDRVHIAMVVDEYGGIAGLVTIEDILEEIVGEIQDEYDAEPDVDVQVIGPGIYQFNARLDIYSLSKLLDTELPDDDADTLGGLIYSLLGHVPAVGESVEVGGWRFTVLSLEGRRIGEVRAETMDRPVQSDDSTTPEASPKPQVGDSTVLNFTPASD